MRSTMDGVNGEIDLEVSGPVPNGVGSETGSVNGGMPGEVLHDTRIRKLKAKRLLKQLSKETAVVNVQTGNLVTPPRRWKNTRKPRNGYGRGLAKKGNVKLSEFYPELFATSSNTDVSCSRSLPNFIIHLMLFVMHCFYGFVC